MFVNRLKIQYNRSLTKCFIAEKSPDVTINKGKFLLYSLIWYNWMLGCKSFNFVTIQVQYVLKKNKHFIGEKLQNPTFHAVNKISILFSNAAGAAIFELAILIIVAFSGFTWPTLSVKLYSKHGGKTLFESFLGATLNNRAHIRPSGPHNLLSPEALYKFFKRSIPALVLKTTNWLVVNFNWNRKKK